MADTTHGPKQGTQKSRDQGKGAANRTNAAQGDKTRGDNTSQSGQQSSHSDRRVIQHGRSAPVSSLGASLTTKAGSLFVLCAQNGDIDATLNGGYGLYFHDTRFLDSATLRLNRKPLTVLLGRDGQGDRSVCELTNPDLPADAADDDGTTSKDHAGTKTDGKTDGGSSGEGSNLIPKETIGVRRERILSNQMVEHIQVHNFNTQPVTIAFDLQFDAQFESMFTVRGAEPGKRGALHDPRWKGATLTFRYDGADDRTRTTALTFDPPPDHQDGGALRYRLSLAPNETTTITVTGKLRDQGAGDLETTPRAPGDISKSFDKVTIETSNPLFDRVLNRAFISLRMLITREHGDTYFAAGVPWFVALFGRDSIITALQTVGYDPSIAANTLRVLAGYQGTEVNEFQDEEPGKIPHELRVGEQAHLHEVPQIPYYGTVDATPLFVVLVGEYVRWSGDVGLWHELRDNVDRALAWIDGNARQHKDGFVTYASKSAKGLANQGWKDSGNSITNQNGSLAEPPIALVEVQGYVYRAKLSAAWLYEQDGDTKTASRLRAEAGALRARFGKAFWMADRKFLAIAIEKGGRQAESVASNGGQALWSGIVDDDHAAAVAAMLTGDTMFSGWGIRTLAEGEAAYNPIDYQVGAVWPHDNSLIAAGLKRYGHDDKALAVFSAIFDAATNFTDYRLPEVFAGFSRQQYPVPVHYPVACSPQAWAAGAIPYLLQTCLGLAPNALQHRLQIVRPALPSWLASVTVKGLAIGDARVDLRYELSNGTTLVAVLKKQGDIAVDIEY